MPQRLGPAGFESPLQPPHLAGTEPQGIRGLAIGDPARTGRLNQSRAVQLLAAQRESLHGGRTLSRGSYPRTFSRSTSTSGPADLDRPRPARLLSRNHVPPHTRRAPEDLMRTRREFLALSAGAVAATSLGPRRADPSPKRMPIVRKSSFTTALDDYLATTLL